MMSHLHIVRWFVVYFPMAGIFPLSYPAVQAFLMMCVHTSPTIRKWYGASVHPWWSPRSMLKLSFGLPLRLIAAVAFWKSNSTHPMNSPFCALHEKEKSMKPCHRPLNI